tara:strand:+ start:310 stop:1230 length:921 start_codon:yes stop_codon:yes gene_type:complete
MYSVNASELVTAEQLRKIKEKKDWINIFSILSNWVQILVAISLFSYFPSFLTFILAIIIIGCRQFALAVLAHEGAHNLLFKNPKINDFITQWFCSFPLFQDNRQYRPYHLKHHRFTETSKDPDKVLSAPFPIKKISFFRKVVRDLLGITGLKRYRGSLISIFSSRSDENQTRREKIWKKISGFTITNLIILAVISTLFHWSLFFLLWWLPSFTYYSLIIRIRNIAEHAVTPGLSDLDNTRTTKASGLIKFFMVPHNVNYHLEHHLFTNCPWYNLPMVHDMLVKNGYLEKMCVEGSYLAVLNKATSG